MITVARFCLLAIAATLAGCSSTGSAPEPTDPAAWLQSLDGHCGRAYAGEVEIAPASAADPAWGLTPVVLHVRSCEARGKVLLVSRGEDRSLVWLLGPTRDGLLLRHSVHGDDGRPADVSRYGGLARGLAGGQGVEFPADDATRALFQGHGLDGRASAIWRFELDDERLVYEEHWPGHRLRVGFDLSRPVDPPPLPWFEAALR